MFRSILLVSLLLSSQAYAGVETFKVKGMHCEGCVESMQGEVCDKDYKTCKVDLETKLDPKNGQKNVGVLMLESADGKPIDVAALEKKVKNAGEHYELVVPTKKQKKK